VAVLRITLIPLLVILIGARALGLDAYWPDPEKMQEIVSGWPRHACPKADAWGVLQSKKELIWHL
jgi:hypothetical protein